MTTPAPAKRTLCGFCITGHHTLCPGSIRNGSNAASPVWTCLCGEQDHTIGGAHRDAVIERLPASARPVPAQSGEPRPGGKGKTARAGFAGFPEGVCSPVQFRHLLVREGLAPASFRPQTVYTWVNQAGRGGTGAFPVRYYDQAGTAHETSVDGTRPGVLIDQARAWCRDR